MDGKFYVMTETEFKCSGQKLRKLPLPSELDYPNAGEKISFMDVSYNKITCLDGLEFYPALETLILDCNQVGDVDFPYCPSMTSLSINKNQIADLDKLLDNLKRNAPSLRFLSLLGNRACPHQLQGLHVYDDADYRRFRCYVIHCLPGLKFLDSTPISRSEREEALLRGQYFKTAKPTLWQPLDFTRENGKDFLPLPPAKSNLTSHRDFPASAAYHLKIIIDKIQN